MYFKTFLVVISKHLPTIPNLLGMPAGKDSCFLGSYTQFMDEKDLPEKCRNFFQENSQQLELPLEYEPKQRNNPSS